MYSNSGWLPQTAVSSPAGETEHAGDNTCGGALAPATTASLAARLGGLRGRFLLLVLGVLVGVGTAVGLGSVYMTGRIVHGLGSGYALQYANQLHERLLAGIQREQVLTQKLVDSPLLKRWADNESDPELTRQALAELDSYRTLFLDKNYFFVVDASRNYYANNAANEFAGKELRHRLNPADKSSGWYFATMKDVDNFELRIDPSTEPGVAGLWISATLRSSDGRKLGLGGSRLGLSSFVEDIVRSTDPGVETWLVDDAGLLLGHPDGAPMQANTQNTDAALRKSAFSLLHDARQVELLSEALAQLACEGKRGSTQRELTVDGRPRLVAVSYLPEIHWAVIVLVDPARVTQLASSRPILVLLAVSLLAIVLLISCLLDRLVLAPLARLAAHARAVADGRYDTVSPERPDEIGQLAASFNRMTTAVADRTQNLELTLAQRSQALQQSNSLLEAADRKIVDSIDYARLIQSSLLPKPAEMARLFADCAVLWLPRDGVGGDFYAVYPDGADGCLLALGDCSGHGVAGAFMTMATKTLLDRAVDALGMDDPAALLDELRSGVAALQHGGQASGDGGLDLALLHLAPGRKKLTFAAARLALWVVHADGSLDVIKGDRRSISHRRSGERDFANQHIDLGEGDRYYLFSDGILDQNGGARGIALGRSRLAGVLRSWHTQPLAQQAATLQQLLADYRGNLPQRDDIALVAVSLTRAPPASRGSA